MKKVKLSETGLLDEISVSVTHPKIIQLKRKDGLQLYINANHLVNFNDSIDGNGVTLELINGESFDTNDDIDASMIYSFLNK